MDEYQNPERLDQLLAEGAAALVDENFTGVRSTWWWERRIGGGIEICQELDPDTMAREIASKTGRDVSEVSRTVRRETGLEDDEPVVLTFEISGETQIAEAARLLAERSSVAEGLAASLYLRIEQATR